MNRLCQRMRYPFRISNVPDQSVWLMTTDNRRVESTALARALSDDSDDSASSTSAFSSSRSIPFRPFPTSTTASVNVWAAETNRPIWSPTAWETSIGVAGRADGPCASSMKKGISGWTRKSFQEIQPAVVAAAGTSFLASLPAASDAIRSPNRLARISARCNSLARTSPRTSGVRRICRIAASDSGVSGDVFDMISQWRRNDAFRGRNSASTASRLSRTALIASSKALNDFSMTLSVVADNSCRRAFVFLIRICQSMFPKGNSPEKDSRPDDRTIAPLATSTPYAMNQGTSSFKVSMRAMAAESSSVNSMHFPRTPSASRANSPARAIDAGSPTIARSIASRTASSALINSEQRSAKESARMFSA